MTTREEEMFFSFGAHYYVTARFAVCSGMTPLCGNLFHHAIEMLLKGDLSRKISLKELSTRKYGHRLRSLWEQFKVEHPDPDLKRFDASIDNLERFEDIRYPDLILQKGLISNISFHPLPPAGGPLRSEPKYDLLIPEIDELVHAIFEVSNKNPTFFFQSLNPDGRTYLEKWNNEKFL